MRKFIADYVKSCSKCIRYKATNQKPSHLLQTPVPPQRFESIAIDLFGPLPETTEGVYHTSALTPFLNGTEIQSPVVPLKKRGRPRKQPLIPRGTVGENAIMSVSTPPRRDGLRRLEDRKLREQQEMVREQQEFEKEKVRLDREFQLEKLRLENERLKGLTSTPEAKRELVSKKRHWVSALLTLRPSEINQLTAREAEGKFDDYDYIKGLSLKRFKLSAEIFRQKFIKHQRNPAQSWRDFVFERTSYFEERL
ncbi:CCHC-type domain-containing protein [Trichonephila clavipes]|nr:CCHC-type domain-containing protein [Trichonephila clavipes]